MLGCVFIMLLIAANSNQEEQIAWAAAFCFVIIQDILLNPVFGVIVDYFYRLVRKKERRDKDPTQSKIDKLLDKTMMIEEIDDVNVIKLKYGNS